MAFVLSDDHLQRKCIVILAIGLAESIRKVSGGCGGERDDNHSRPGSSENESQCWYELWYFWLIVVLVLITVVILVLFYCKHTVKNSSRSRGHRVTPVMTMPQAPPLYEAPGHEPPTYDAAMATSVSAANRSGQGQGQRQMTREDTLPGYVTVEPSHDDTYDNLSTISMISGALSNPPPYSPPHSAYRAQRRHDDVHL